MKYLALALAALMAHHTGTVPLALASGSPFARTASWHAASLGSADYDEDGVPDLVVTYGLPDGGGAVVIYRGNVDAIYANAPDAKARKQSGAFVDEPFLPDVRVFEVSERASFVGTGDFDCDGHWDVVVAREGGRRLVLLKGDGGGALREERAVDVGGRITALTSGEVNRADGIDDLVVGVTTTEGHRALVFESPRGAINAEPEAIAVGGEVRSLALGQFDESYEEDLAIGAGDEVVVVRGRDRKLGAASTKRLPMGARVRSVAVGNFAGEYEREIAVLVDGGRVEVVDPRASWSTRLATARRAVVGGWQQSQASRVVLRPSAHAPVDAVATIEMRLNRDALADTVILRPGTTRPETILTLPVNTFTVTTTADSGAGSLRQAIEDANASAGADAIDFNIGGAPPFSIPLATALPPVTETATIDGTTQPGFAGTPIVEVRGDGIPGEADGVVVAASNCAVRGLVVNRFKMETLFLGTGIVVGGQGSTTVEGCYVGTDVSGTVAQRNERYGIVTYSPGNTIGGTVAAARNVASGNGTGSGPGGIGIFIVTAPGVAGGNFIRGNYAGLDATGTQPLGNFGSGIDLRSTGSVVGGTTAGARNVVAANGLTGIAVAFGARGCLVQGNTVGPTVDGDGPVANTDRAVHVDVATEATIGGTSPAASNTLAFNAIGVSVTCATRNRIVGNSIHSNSQRAIDLGQNGQDPNDSGDQDEGPNGYQNYPTLTSVARPGGQTRVQGTLRSVAFYDYTIDFYSNPSCHGSGFGEGRTYLGSVVATADGSGTATFDTTLAAAIGAGDVVTATATDEDGNTSEFSRCLAVGASARDEALVARGGPPTSATLLFDPPDPADGPLAPPRYARIVEVCGTASKVSVERVGVGVELVDVTDVPSGERSPAGVTAYKVYSSPTPNVPISMENLYATLPPDQTSVGVPTDEVLFFVVTACYDDQESPPSNEVSTGAPAPVIAKMKVKGEKISAKGSGFDAQVEVYLDRQVYFVAPSAVKRGKKCVQAGALRSGQTMAEYVAARGGEVAISFRNTTGGGITTRKLRLARAQAIGVRR
jgi:hypothetical protein